MFRQHKIICENKEITSYLFLYDQDIDRDTMKTIFSQLSTNSLEQRIHDYFKKNQVTFLGKNIKIVYLSTIIKDIKDFSLPTHQIQTPSVYADNVITLYP